jgi:hypothetical protein
MPRAAPRARAGRKRFEGTARRDASRREPSAAPVRIGHRRGALDGTVLGICRPVEEARRARAGVARRTGGPRRRPSAPPAERAGRGGGQRRARAWSIDRAQPRRHLRLQHPDGPRDRVLVRLDGEPRGRGGASAPDGRGHRHQHDHGHDRRLGRRVDRGEHRREPRGGRQWASRGVRVHARVRGLRGRRGAGVRGDAGDPPRIVGGRLAAAGAVARR